MTSPSINAEHAWAADAELMRRVAAGDAGASRVLVDRELGALLALAYRILGNRAEAEDVAQESFLRLWRMARRWQPKAKVRTWLSRVAYNLSIDRLRVRKPSDPIDEAVLPAPGGGPSSALQRNQVAHIVETAIAQLPDRQRAAIALVHFQEFSNIEAAETLGVSVDALESLLARGRRSLKGALADQRTDLLGEP
ncbi:MAG: RNA polymerase sigma factor [Alphaproteobacteria bacterium]